MLKQGEKLFSFNKKPYCYGTAFHFLRPSITLFKLKLKERSWDYLGLL